MRTAILIGMAGVMMVPGTAIAGEHGKAQHERKDERRVSKDNGKEERQALKQQRNQERQAGKQQGKEDRHASKQHEGKEERQASKDNGKEERQASKQHERNGDRQALKQRHKDELQASKQRERGEERQAAKQQDRRQLKERQTLQADKAKSDWHKVHQQNQWQARQHHDGYRSYTAPVHNWSYRPVIVGFQLQPSFYGSRYYVNDYGAFQLRAPGRYQRWIRYGDDVLLMNVRTGRVLQVLPGRYW
jgi:Ni/Co efflux regulator RcnB